MSKPGLPEYYAGHLVTHLTLALGEIRFVGNWIMDYELQAPQVVRLCHEAQKRIETAIAHLEKEGKE